MHTRLMKRFETKPFPREQPFDMSRLPSLAQCTTVMPSTPPREPISVETLMSLPYE